MSVHVRYPFLAVINGSLRVVVSKKIIRALTYADAVAISEALKTSGPTQ